MIDLDYRILLIISIILRVICLIPMYYILTKKHRGFGFIVFGWFFPIIGLIITLCLRKREIKGLGPSFIRHCKKKEKKEAEDWLTSADEQGYAETIYNLDVSYSYNGQVLKQNDVETIKYYQEAAEQGNIDAQYNLGNCYYAGRGVLQNYEEAVKWYSKAAESGHAGAQYNLGLCYYNGDGVLQDCDEAIMWFKKAAEQENVDAEFALGVCFDNVPQNDMTGSDWNKKAEEMGPSQYLGGLTYVYGNGVPREAAEWYLKAAQRGHSQAQYNLAQYYYYTIKNYVEATNWLKKVVEQGVHKDKRVL